MVFVRNWPIFQFFFMQNRLIKFFYDIVNRKNTFVHYKNKKLKKSKNINLSKGVDPWLCSKIGQFSILFY